MLSSSQVAKVFTSKNINSVSDGDFSLLNQVAECYVDKFDDIFTIRNVFDFSFELLRKEYRNEYFYKNVIANKILIGRHSVNTSTMFTEFRVGQNKADCVIVNDISTCYEIKTEFDNLGRLQSQLHSYLLIFDKVYVVVSDKNLTEVLQKSPFEVGVILLSKKGTLSEIREASLVKTPIDTKVLMRSLRREEYIGLVKAVYGDYPKVKNTEIFRECCKLLSSADNNSVREEFRKVIRKTRAIDKDFILSLPSSLVVAGLAFDLTRNARLRLIDNMSFILSKETVCIPQSSKVSSLN